MRLIQDVEKRYHDCKGETYLAYSEVDNQMMGRVCVRKIGWFGVEFCHLLVREEYRRKGVATFLNKELFKRYKKFVIFSTVRVDNLASRALMSNLKFETGLTVISKNSGDEITLYTYDNTRG